MGVLSFLLWLATGGWRIDGSDSLAVLRSARRAQEAYETTRRYNLPEQFGSWGDACGERFGQICAWSQGSVADETPPEEPWRCLVCYAALRPGANLPEALAPRVAPSAKLFGGVVASRRRRRLLTTPGGQRRH